MNAIMGVSTSAGNVLVVGVFWSRGVSTLCFIDAGNPWLYAFKDAFRDDMGAQFIAGGRRLGLTQEVGIGTSRALD